MYHFSNSPAHHRCVLPHPERMVIVIGRDLKGTDFLCLSCRKEFRLPKMAFYEETTNSMLAGWCYMGTHTSNAQDIDSGMGPWQQKTLFGYLKVYIMLDEALLFLLQKLSSNFKFQILKCFRIF